MWTLPPPNSSDSESELIKALTFANGAPVFPITPAQQIAVLDLYQHYDILGGRPSAALTGETLEAGLRNAIHDAYEQVR